MQVQSMASPAPAYVRTRAARPEPQASEIRMIGVTMTYARGQEICGEGESAELVYKVIRGAVRSLRVLADGRRQICDFYLPGDIFGFEAGPERRATAEALSDVTLVVVRRAALADEGDGVMTGALLRLAVADLQRCQDHVLTLGRRSAHERVASFLVDLAGRLGESEVLDLPMSRQDMADYLGLTIETVSRTLTHLQGEGLISLPGCRAIGLTRLRALARLCE